MDLFWSLNKRITTEAVMKGKISSEGELHIWRTRHTHDGTDISEFRGMECCFSRLEQSCMDFCSHFSEPEKMIETETMKHSGSNQTSLKVAYSGKVKLSLCNKTIIFTEFTDER